MLRIYAFHLKTDDGCLIKLFLSLGNGIQMQILCVNGFHRPKEALSLTFIPRIVSRQPMKNAGKGGMGGLFFKKHTRHPD